MLLLSYADFKNNLSGTLSECLTAWIQIRTDILSVLIWIQTVCKCYQQTTKVTARKKRVKKFYTIFVIISARCIIFFSILYHLLNLGLNPDQLAAFDEISKS